MGQTPKKFYKVITKGTRRSAIITAEGAQVYYPINKWAKPNVKGSKLFVFGSRKAALAFIESYHRFEYLKIAPCEVINPSIMPIGFELIAGDFSKMACQEYWLGKTCPFLGESNDSAVYLCDSVKCLQ